MKATRNSACVITGRPPHASAEHLQLASSAFGVKEGLTTAKPMARATAIFISVSIIGFFCDGGRLSIRASKPPPIPEA